MSGLGTGTDVYDHRSTNWALFTHNILHVGDRVDLTLGLRYTHEIKSLRATFQNDNVICPRQQALLGPLLGTPLASAAGGLISFSCGQNSTFELDGVSINDRISSGKFTGTSSISFRPTQGMTVYATYSRGYKSGGFNLDRSALSQSQLLPFAQIGGAQALVRNLEFSPETVDSFEIGAKYSRGPLTVSGALFQEQFTNFQLNTFNGFAFVVQNVSGCGTDLAGADRDGSATTGSCAADKVGYGVRSQGLELEGSVRPARNFTVNLGVTYADTKSRDNLVGDAKGAPLDPALRLLPGQQFPNAPLWVTTSSVAWTPAIGNGGLSALFYVDGRLTSDYNTGSDLFPQKIQDGYFVMNGRVAVRGPDKRWSVEVWARNLLDIDYAQIVIASPLQAGASNARFAAPAYPGGTQIFSAFLAEPRTFGLTLSTRF